MKIEKTKTMPPGWSDDYLSDFLENAEHNRFATFVMMNAAYVKLRQIDDIFMKPSLSVWRVADEDTFRAGLFHRAHGFYRAACGSAMAGQIAESFSMCRAVLEASAYALHMSKSPGADKIWYDRHEIDGMKAVKAEFTIKNIRRSIADFSVDTDKRFDRLYQDSIDMGAHPNERSITASIEIKNAGKEHIIRSLLLNPGGDSQKYAMISVARSGACALEMLMEVFSARYAELNTTEEFKVACQGL